MFCKKTCGYLAFTCTVVRIITTINSESSSAGSSVSGCGRKMSEEMMFTAYGYRMVEELSLDIPTV